VESVENQTQVSHTSHRPLQIPQNRRDLHISTALACTAWKSGKPKTGFPLSHSAHATTTTVSSFEAKNQRKEVGRCAASSFSYSALPLVERNPVFMLILQLENADPAGLQRAATCRRHSAVSWAPRF